MESISISHFITGNISTGHESVSCDCLGSQVVHSGCFSGYPFEFALFLSPLDCLLIGGFVFSCLLFSCII